jgi:hypothetical protein
MIRKIIVNIMLALFLALSVTGCFVHVHVHVSRHQTVSSHSPTPGQ